MSRYQTRPVVPVEIDAVCLTKSITMYIGDEDRGVRAEGRVGDYLITEVVSGKQYLMGADEFHRKYVKVVSTYTYNNLPTTTTDVSYGTHFIESVQGGMLYNK